MMRKEQTVKPKPRNLRVFKKREEKKGARYTIGLTRDRAAAQFKRENQHTTWEKEC